MTDEELRSLIRSELAPMRAELASVRALAEGIPLTNRALTVLQQEFRALRAAFNDFARTNVTAGEIEALHEDVNKTMANDLDLERRIVVIERRLDTLEKG